MLAPTLFSICHARGCFNGGPDPTWYCFSGIKLTTWEHLNVFTSINISEGGST